MKRRLFLASIAMAVVAPALPIAPLAPIVSPPVPLPQPLAVPFDFGSWLSSQSVFLEDYAEGDARATWEMLRGFDAIDTDGEDVTNIKRLERRQ